MEKGDLSHTVSRTISWYSHYGKQYNNSSKLRMDHHMIQLFHFGILSLKNMETKSKEICAPMFITVVFIIVKNMENQFMNEWIKKMYIYT